MAGQKLTKKQTEKLKQFKNTFKALVDLFQSALKPPSRLSVSEWAAKNRIVSSEEAAAPGPWDNAHLPYLVEPMNAISDPHTRRIVFISGTQQGKSSCLLNAIGYYIDLDPCPIMMVQPTIAMAETFSGKRLSPMLRDSPSLRAKIAPEKSRTSSNTLLEKTFPGGYIVLSGANSAPSLKSRPVRVLLFDEVDEAPENLASQGDPIELAVARTDAFPNRKVVLTSTPTVKGRSRIEAAYQESTRERWSHKCPGCGNVSQFNFERINLKTLNMRCPRCNEEYSRQQWTRYPGQWVAENPGHATRGFHVNGFDAQITWAELVEKYFEAKKRADEGDSSLLITFTNTKLAESWEEKGEVVESHVLEYRREEYDADLPDGVCVITMGVDVQHTRLAYEVVGWGEGFESWGLEYGEIFGDPRQGYVWQQLDEVIHRHWIYANGVERNIERIAVDTGDGNLTMQLYSHCQKRMRLGLFPVKGQYGDKLPIVRPSKKFKEQMLYMVGVDGIKYDIYSWLKVEERGPGYAHFPKSNDGTPVNGYDSRFFEMLTAERRVAVNTRAGFTRYEWQKISGVRNEALDTRVYARAALRMKYPNDLGILKRIAMTQPWGGERVAVTAASSTPVVAPRAPVVPIRRRPVNRNQNAANAGFAL